MMPLDEFIRLRRMGIAPRIAAEMSGLPRTIRAVSKWLLVLVIVTIAWLAASSSAEAIQSDADNRVASKIANQAGEINELRKIVAACLGDKAGALIIGGEYFLCRAVSIGERK